MQEFFGWMSQVILAIALPYFAISLVLGIRVARRHGMSLLSQETPPGAASCAGPARGTLYFLVPCLNEAIVIGDTVRRLLDQPGCTVIVVDDGSDDGTAAGAYAVAAVRGDERRLTVVERSGAQSREGKGAALNAGLPTIVADVAARGLNPDEVFVGVMDADGRLSAGAANAALSLFEDSRVGGVQLIVRIRNRRKLIAQFQDIEFWMISALSQFARSISGTVSLGGNGQFTRLSAIQQLGDQPWSRSLTEDLDLGLRLIAAGWRITTTTEGYVDQQGVDTLPRLLRQRTRWYQGHMASIRRLPELWKSQKVNEIAALEVTSYLLVPWLIVLPWSILQQWIIFQLVTGSGHGIFATGLGGLSWRLTYGLLWYVLSFAPNLVIGLIYARRTRAVTLHRALMLGHLMIAWNYIGYLAAWRAVARMVRGSTDWTKTSRSREPSEASAEYIPKPRGTWRPDDPQPANGTRPGQHRAIPEVTAVHSGVTPPMPRHGAARPRPAGRAVAASGELNVGENPTPGVVAVILGTRPEIIKLAGIIDLLGDDAFVIHTGQHYDDDLSQIFLDRLGLSEPAHRMQLGALSRAEQLGRGTMQIATMLTGLRPDAVIVQGDTNSALAGALAANATGFPLVHVEAGLRSYDRTMPEEHNRVLIDHLSDLLAAPTPIARRNLSREGIAHARIICCGNTVVEAVQRQLPDAPTRKALLDRFHLEPRQYVLATIHRPENTDNPQVLGEIVRQLGALPLPVIAPLHPRTLAAARRAGLGCELAKLTVLEPLAGDEFLALAAEAALLVSDSGGVQEEATVLGLPLVVVRRSTERPEAFETFATLVRPEAIAKASAAILAGGTHLRRALASTPSPYGDGTASRSIVEEVRSRFGRPTAVSAPANASEGRPVATAYGARHARRSSDSHSPAVTKSATGNSPALSAP